jgi:DNA-binding beta-propeller fold protein YncE
MCIDNAKVRASNGKTGLKLLVGALLALPAVAAAQDPSIFDAGKENRLGLTFTPDGKRAFWTEWDGAWGSKRTQRVIYTAELRNETWTKPAPAPFSQQYSDDDPYVSPDGRWLYFVSERPVNDADEEPDADIWRYSLIEEGRLEHLPVNSEAAEYSPVITSSGVLYFASARDGGPGQGDIYRAAPIEDGFAPAEALGPAINSRDGEWNLWVSGDESEMIFEASSRSTNVSESGDLYYSWRTPAGWTFPVPITSLNSAGSELVPRLHPDGDTLYYTTAPLGGHARIATANWRELRTANWRELRSLLRAEYAPTLLVANRSSHDVSFVDLSRGEVIARVPTGEGPHLLSNVSDGRVLATGYGEYPRPHAKPVSRRPPFVESLNSRLTLIDVRSRTVLLDRIIEDCAKPHASWIIGESAYVTCETEKQVLALDLTNGQIKRSFATRQEGSHVLGFASGSRMLAVSNTDSGSLTLINVDSGETIIVDVGNGSEGLLVVDDHIWVGNAWEGSVSVVDARTQTMLTKIESVCNFPISFGDGRQHVWVACFGSAELVSVDTDTFAPGRRISLKEQPLNLLLHPDFEIAYVSLPRMNAVAEIDLNSGEELRRINVGIEPDGLRWAQ